MRSSLGTTVVTMALCVAACVAACPDHLVNRTRCNPVNDIVGPEAETCVGTSAEFPVVDALEWAFECGLPIELTVGLTMSLTGNYSDESMNQNVLQVLKDWSNQISNKTDGMKLGRVTLGQIKMCTRFCVMDDESSEEKMVQLYRSFLGDGNSTSHGIPLLLGPGTEAFRNAAAQVANDYQRPMILWSIPQELRRFPILPKDYKLSEVIESIEVPKNQVIQEQIAKMGESSSDSEIYSSLYDYPSNSCQDFPVPAGYYLRSGAEFLSCGGPCDPVAHLDLCCRPSSGLRVSGTWSPSSSLLSGGWQDGCLRGHSLANETTNMSLVLNFDRSPAPVIISLNWTNIAPLAPQPYLVVDEQVFKVHETLLDVLREDSVVNFDYVGDAEVTWEICLRESCAAVHCPPPLLQRSGESCLGRNCTDPTDTAICCSLEPVDLNGIMWKGGSLNSSVFDLVAPVSGWALDVIQQLQKSIGGRLLCVAQQLSNDGLFFSNLCRHYTRMIGQTKADVMLAGGALGAVSSLVRLKPGPSMVLVCSDLGFYMGFLRASMMLTPDHGTVMSCLPFGSLLENVRGFELNFRSLEPQPWPSYRQLSSFKIQQPLADLASLRLSFNEVYQQHLQQNGSFPTELLFLYSAWQVIEKTAMTLAGSILQYSFLKQRGRRDSLQELASTLFSTYLGGVSFERGQRKLQRTDVATRQAVPLTVTSSGSMSSAMAGLAPNVSWTLKMVKFLRSSVRIADVFEPILAVSNQLNINAWYPCPEGCVVHKTGCRACPPGTYRSPNQRECQPCLSGSYQDNYAASTCFMCPKGVSCNVTGALLAKPGYFAVKAQESIYAAWNGPEACSIEPGGGLATLHPNDIGSWSHSKNEALWRVHQCEPKSVCLGENVCSVSQVGFRCHDCQTGYSRILSHGDTCVACLDFTPLLWRCVAFAMLQVFVALLLAATSQKDVAELDCLLSPILLSLLVALQCFWMLFQTVERAGMFDEKEAVYGGLRNVIDAFMVPFLLPLLECAPEGSLTRSAENQAWAVFASAICIYFLIIILWLLLYCLNAARRGLQRGGISLKACLVAANHLVLPSLLYWTLTTALHCTREGSDACDESVELRDPHVAAMVFVSLLFFLEGFAVWVYRHDFFQVSHRRDFGLLCTGVHRPYLLWPLWEFLYLLMMASLLSASNALELPVVAVFWFIVLANALSVLMLAIVHPYLSMVVLRYKQSIARSICVLSILLSSNSVFVDVDFFADQNLEFLRWIEQLLIEILLLYLVAKGLWILFMNRVVIPVTIMQDTFYPWKSLRLLVSFLRRPIGLHRASVLKRHGYIEFHTQTWSKSEKIGISWSIGHILHGQLQISSILRMEEVHTVLEAAVRAVCRSHKNATLKHIYSGGYPKIARRAWKEGKTISECIQRHAGDFITHELSVAVHDQNVDVASAVRAAQAAAELRAEKAAATEKAAAMEGELEEEEKEEKEEEEVNLPSPPGAKRAKVLLLPRRWPRPRRPSRRNRAAVNMEDDTLFEREVEDEVDVEKQVWDLRKGYKRLEGKMAVMLRRMTEVSDPLLGSKPSGALRAEVKEVFSVLNEIQMQLDTVQVDHISAERITSWIASVQNLWSKADVKAQPRDDSPTELTPELVELLGGNECNEALDLETTATSTGSRSHSEDSLERHLFQTNEPPAPPAASTGGTSTAPSVASIPILRSKPRPVGRSTARLHAWQT